MKKPKEKWKLTNKVSSRSVSFTKFKDLEFICKELIELENHEKYEIEYLKGYKVMETVNISDYFNC